MKFLNLSENRNFYINYNYIVNANTNKLITFVDKNVDILRGELSEVKTYSSGVMTVLKKDYSIKIEFFKNNAKRLFTLYKGELNEMENRVFDINAYACSSGVLVATIYYGDFKQYDYYLYKGGVIESFDLEELSQKVDEYEKDFGFYIDKPNFDNSHPATDFLVECMDNFEQ